MSRIAHHTGTVLFGLERGSLSSSLRELDAVALATNATVFLERDTWAEARDKCGSYPHFSLAFFSAALGQTLKSTDSTFSKGIHTAQLVFMPRVERKFTFLGGPDRKRFGRACCRTKLAGPNHLLPDKR